MPAYWWLAPALVAVLCVWCVGMWLWHLRKARQHRPDCACDPCFAKYAGWVEKMRDIAARQAAELNQEKQR